VLEEKAVSERGRAELEKLPLGFWASRRRQDLLELLDRMNPKIEELTATAEQEAKKRPDALRLMTHPGVGPLTALAYVLIIGTPTRFARGKQIGTYVGMAASSGWDTSASKATPYCASCWWRLPRRRHEFIRTGDVATCTWRCVGTRALPRSPWGVGWRLSCTGCGGMAARIRSQVSAVRTRDSSVPDMVGSRAPSI
jgi:Transposase IS116/IS110/IS902 family